jgi:biopolymer transport protein ExbD
MKLQRRNVKRGRIEIIPMIDTIVILLIFYMSFSRFVEQTREASIKLPGSYAGDEFRQLPYQVIVNMYDRDKMSIDKSEYTVRELAPLLRGYKAKFKEENPKANMTVVLRANKDMTYKDLSGFMRGVAKAGIADVTFATLDAGGGGGG